MQGTCQSPKASHRGFTLLELLFVVLIVGILMAIMTPIVGTMRERARQTDCQSNLRQFGTALIVYRADHRGRNPPWMSNLYPDYVDDKSLYICKSDPARGLGRTRPEALTPADESEQQFSETVDNESNPHRGTYGANTVDIKANSYFYEFSAAPIQAGWEIPDGPWGEGSPNPTWGEWKEWQLAYGNSASPTTDPKAFSTSRMPIIRCYHHYVSTMPGYENQEAKNSENISSQPLTFNVAYAGNIFVAPLWWEGRLEPGEGADW